jgi:hypothetical protein
MKGIASGPLQRCGGRPDRRRFGVPDGTVYQWLDVAALSLVTATTSVTIAKSKAFLRLRRLAAARGRWLRDLVRCPYCLSHWIALVLVPAYRPVLAESGVPVLDLLVSLFSVVALSALWSLGICRSLQAMDAIPGDERSEPIQRRTP